MNLGQPLLDSEAKPGSTQQAALERRSGAADCARLPGPYAAGAAQPWPNPPEHNGRRAVTAI
jgi:hypothetical protein